MRRSDFFGGMVQRIEDDLDAGIERMAQDIIEGFELRLLAEWMVDQMEGE